MSESINTSSFSSICLQSSQTGFCSTFLHVLGMIDFCVKHDCSFRLPEDKEQWFSHYKRTHQSDCSLYDAVFSPESFSRLNYQNTKPYDANFVIPPSIDPIFNLTMLTSENGFITEGWRNALHLCLKYVTLSSGILDMIKNDSDTYAKTEPTVGVHIRGTDIENHGSLGSLDSRLSILDQQTQDIGRIFLATDEQSILDACKQRFGSKLVYLDSCVRSDSKAPIHEGWRHGKQFDCINNLTSLIREISILAYGTDHLFLSRSSVGILALVFNPRIGYTPLDKIESNHDVFHYRNRLNYDLNYSANQTTLNFR